MNPNPEARLDQSGRRVHANVASTPAATSAAANCVPEAEQQRLAALRRYAILDTPPDGAFDRITALAARVFDVPIALVSLVDADRIWFKSRHGIEVEEIDRVPGLCASAILQYEPWIVTNAEIDPRTLASPLVVGELGLRFYAGVPLTTRDGYNLGTINVIDRQPREVSPAEIATLEDLAAIVIDELEMRLAARMEAQRVDQFTADFIATVSHEMRTPLAAVYGAAKTLHRGDSSIDRPTREQLLSMLEEGAERLTEIVVQILAVRQLELGQQDGVSEIFDPATLVRSVVDAGRSRDLTTVTAVVDRGVPATVDGDESTLRRILEQLLDNATAHTGRGGRIEVGVEPHAEGLRFWVGDDGPGVPEREQERIFEKFYRLDPTNHDGDGGIGLGLYSCRLLAARVGAHVALEPGSGGGSRFVVDVPLHPAAGANPSTEPMVNGVSVYRSDRRGKRSSGSDGHNP